MANEPSPSMFAATDGYAAQFSDAILLVGRILLGWVMFITGWGKVFGTGFAGGVAYFTALGIPNPGFWVYPSMYAELILGAALILGVATRYAAIGSFLYLIVATALAHRYWEVAPGPAAGNQFNHFIKNLSIMGGMLGYLLLGAGRFSVDNWLRNR